MKTGYRNITKLFSLMLLAGIVFASCSDVAGPNQESGITSESFDHNANIFDEYGTSSSSFTTCGSATLYAGQTEQAGTVDFKFEDGILTVEYNSKSGWGISETHLWIGTSLDSMPAAGNGAPKNGHFPYGGNYKPAVTSTSYTIILSEHGIAEGDEFYVVAHAVTGEFRNGSLRKTETAYAGENKGDSKRWFYYTKVTCDSDISSQGGFQGGVTNGK